MQQVSLTDPTWTTSEPNAFHRASLVFINDVRDTPFLKLIATLLLTVVPSGVFMIVSGFRWWHAAVHLVLVFWFLGPYILMLHNTSHRKLFKKKWERLNHFIPWFLGPFFGETPDTYFAHHVGMHHPENNMEEDLSSTLPYRRDSVRGFVRYFLRFFFGVIVELPRYFLRKNRRSLVVKSLAGELLFFAVTGALAYFTDWRAVVAVLVVPYVSTRFLMMCGNWGQHAFVDEAAPENCYRNSITCINTGYNRRCFNDGYHIGHHVKQTRHWTEMPEDFTKNLATYAKEGAVVFDGIDFFIVWMFLMLKRYDWLARRYVKLDGAEKSEAEIIELLQSRTRWTRAAA
ncbi:MAG: fatty acid desaturase [Labilithrix sp.]|nr:fatty acid desaturase [Labilithrix sp.]MCW5813147.1 fatty acid desaturase [Labilithrix sp.]